MMAAMNAQELIGRLRHIDPQRAMAIQDGKLVALGVKDGGPWVQSEVVVWDDRPKPQSDG
jgi:hypothetical protein